jgi:hypothetical protein
MRAPVVLMVVVLVAACGNVAENVAEQAIERGLEAEGGGDVDVNVDEDGGTINIQTDDGNTNINMGGGELPEELTIPVPDGYSVLSSTSTSGDQPFVAVSLEYPASDVEDLVAFYDDYFGSGEGVTKQESNTGGDQTWTWVSADYTTSVSVSLFDGDDVAAVGITQAG